MNAYRSSGNGGGNGAYTVSITNAGVTTILSGSTAYLYQNNTSINGNISIGANVNRTAFMFEGATNFNGNVYFETTNVNTYNMFNNSGTKVKRVYYNSSCGNLAASLVNDAANWSTITNGHYYSPYNLYAYNNYVPS